MNSDGYAIMSWRLIIKKYFVVFACVLVLCGSCAHLHTADQSGKILMIVREESTDYDWFIAHEIIPMIRDLRSNNIAFDVWCLNQKPIQVSKSETLSSIAPADINIDNYKGVLVPCMGAGTHAVPNEVTELVNQAYKKNKIIAAQNSSELFLSVDFQVSHTAMKPGVVTDGNVITSYNCPYTAMGNKAPADTKALIQALKKKL
jgi:hypothetical protein